MSGSKSRRADLLPLAPVVLALGLGLALTPVSAAQAGDYAGTETCAECHDEVAAIS